MKLDPVNILLNNNFKPEKKFYFISGNETTLIEKIADTLVKQYKKKEGANLERIDTIENFVDEAGLFANKKIYTGKNCKGINIENLNKIRDSENIFIFVQENSPKTKKIKNIFVKDGDCCLIDCYEIDKSSKIRILNEFIQTNNLKIEEDLYWMLVEKLDNRYFFLENSLNKIKDIEQKDINTKNIKKLLTIDGAGKDGLFFCLLNKNNKIIENYRNKIQTNSDVNEMYYYCRFFCQLIIESKNENEYNKNIPLYLFKEKGYLVDIYKKYNFKKKKALLRLLASTEKFLRKESGLSLVSGLRFLLSIKKITIS